MTERNRGDSCSPRLWVRSPRGPGPANGARGGAVLRRLAVPGLVGHSVPDGGAELPLSREAPCSICRPSQWRATGAGTVMPCTSRPARPVAVTAPGSAGSTRRRPAMCSATTGPRSTERRADRRGAGRACDMPCRGPPDEMAARHSGRKPGRTCADVDKAAVCRRVIDCWRALHNDWVTGPLRRVSGSTAGDRAGPSVPACCGTSPAATDILRSAPRAHARSTGHPSAVLRRAGPRRRRHRAGRSAGAVRARGASGGVPLGAPRFRSATAPVCAGVVPACGRVGRWSAGGLACLVTAPPPVGRLGP